MFYEGCFTASTLRQKTPPELVENHPKKKNGWQPAGLFGELFKGHKAIFLGGELT